MQNNANYRGCDGARYNLDLYTKSGNGGVVALDNIPPTRSPTVTPKVCRVENSNDQCSFPFVYRGHLYRGCITQDSPQNNKAWCITSQTGSQVDWDFCDMSSDCTVVPTISSQTQKASVVQSTYVQTTNVPNAGWRFCSREAGTRDWAQHQCNLDPDCNYLHDTDCDGNEYRFCSDIDFNIQGDDQNACTYEKQLPASLDCQDASDEATCTHILQSDSCAEFGTQCARSCRRCTDALRAETDDEGSNASGRSLMLLLFLAFFML